VVNYLQVEENGDYLQIGCGNKKILLGKVVHNGVYFDPAMGFWTVGMVWRLCIASFTIIPRLCFFFNYLQA